MQASSQLGECWGKAGSSWKGRCRAGVDNQYVAEATGLCMLILEGMLNMNPRVLKFNKGEPEYKGKNNWDAFTI